MMRTVAALAFLCCLALVPGCASTPPRFFSVSALATAASTSSDVSVIVGPVSVPSSVDRPQFVLTTGANQVSIDEFNRWASPLQDNLAGVVAENLSALLGTSRVLLSQSSTSAEADYRVQIDIWNFESVPDQSASLGSVWTVRRLKDGKTVSGRTTAREPVEGAGFAALAAAHSRATLRLSTDIAAALSTLRADGSR
jgi:uncharacterized lipoprotein YmbA